MLSFNEKVQEDTGMRVIDLLPKKVKRKIYRFQHQDKYKAALLMMRALRKDPDVIKRGLSKAKIQDIAADHFGLNHREFAKVLNRKTRYEAAPPGMADTVKKFKTDGMDDDMAFALAWKIYNKKKNEAVEYITEATYDIRPQSIADITKLDKYSPAQKADIKILFKYLKDNYHAVINPLIFSEDGGPIKVQRELERQFTIPDIKKTLDIKLSLKFGTGSKAVSAEMKEFGISNSTEFLEMMQTIGFYLKTPLTVNNFVTTLQKQKIFGDYAIREFLNDWNGFVDFCYKDQQIQDSVILLCNGSHFYAKKEIGFKKPYVIWTNISSYYAALKKKEGIEVDIKPNTADCVLIDVQPKELYDALRSDKPIVTDEKTGKLSCDGVEWYQISLKKSKDGAKLGKLTKLIKGKYDVPKSNALASNIAMEEVLMEGMFSDMFAKAKQLGGDAVAKVKKAVTMVLKYTKGLFTKMGKVMKREMRDEMRLIDRLTKRVLKEETLNEKSSFAQQKATLVTDKKLNLEYKKHIIKAFKDVKIVNNDVIAMTKIDNAGFILDGASMNFLLGNKVAFGVINKIVDDVNKNGIKVINELVISMTMGDTNLPVVKVYGHPSKAYFEIISVGKLKQKNPKIKKEQMKILMVDIHPASNKNYWVINLYMFAEMVDGMPKYHQIAIKKSGADSIFDVEGTVTKPGNKITAFKGLFE